MGSFAGKKLPELPQLLTGGSGGASAFDEQQPELVAGFPLEGRDDDEEEEPQEEDEDGFGNDENAVFASPQEFADCTSGGVATAFLPSPSASPSMAIFFPAAASDFC